MKITRLSVGLIKNPSTKVVGMATIELDGVLVMNNIKIIDGKNGAFLGMPSMKNSKGEYKDVYFFNNDKSREYITEKVIAEYIKKVGENPSDGMSETPVDEDIPF